MATSIKLNSPYYWDSSNLVYNRTPLNTTLNNINTKTSRLINRGYAIACNKFNGSVSTEYSSGASIPFMYEVVNNTRGKVIFYQDGIIDIRGVNAEAKIKISMTLWVHSYTTTARPWLRIVDRKTNAIIATAIQSNTNGYMSLVIAEVVVPFNPYADGTMRIHPEVVTNDGATFAVDRGIGHLCSTCTIELLNLTEDIYMA